jgi:hypothetical protein
VPAAGAVAVGLAVAANGILAMSAGTKELSRGSGNEGDSKGEAPASEPGPKADAPYKRPSGATTPDQRASVQGKPCVDCGKVTAKQVADHKTPLVQEHYKTGTIDKTQMRSLDAVQAQCPTCSARQGAAMSRYSQQQRALIKPKE